MIQGLNCKVPMLILVTALVAACGRQEPATDGNGPGAADGVGGQADTSSAAPPADSMPPAPTDPSGVPGEPPASQPVQ
jgi:hypothetical protein